MNNTDFRYHAANAHNKNMLTLLPGRQKSPGEICFPMHWQERMELLRDLRSTAPAMKAPLKQELQFKPRNCGGDCDNCKKPDPFWEEQK